MTSFYPEVSYTCGFRYPEAIRNEDASVIAMRTSVQIVIVMRTSVHSVIVMRTSVQRFNCWCAWLGPLRRSHI